MKQIMQFLKGMLKYRIPICLLLLLALLDVFQYRCRINIYEAGELNSGIVTTEEKIADESTEKGNLVVSDSYFYAVGDYDFIFYGKNDNENNLVKIYSKTLKENYIKESYDPGVAYHLHLSSNDSKVRFAVKYCGEGECSVEKVVIKRYLSTQGEATLVLLNILFIFTSLWWIFAIKYKKKNRVLSWLYHILLLVGFAAVETLILDGLAGNYYHSDYLCMVARWARDGGYPTLFWLNLLIFLAIHLIVFGFIRRPGIALFVSNFLLWIMAEVALNYYLIRGDVFNLTQLQLAGEAAQVLNGFTITFPMDFILWNFGLSVLTALSMKWKKWEYRFYWGVLPVALGIYIIFYIYANTSALLSPIGHYEVYTVSDYYCLVGNGLGIVRTAPRNPEEPEDYSVQTIAAIAETVTTEDEEKSTPDIIFIQCESLYDLSLISDVYWSEDPLETIYEMDEDADTQVMYMFSPVTGGGTCNVEYEALTGYPVYNTDGTPFIDKISAGMTSVVSILDELGYQTTAIHTNTGSFFNRRTVYDALGFDEEIFTEEFEEEDTVINEDKIGKWYDDEAAYKLLIEDYENRDTEKPYFAHVVTTQNHGAYTTEYYDGIDVDGDLSEDANMQLQNYLNLSKLSAESLAELIEYFKGVDNDVILVFWGDHCPGYGMFNIAADNTSETIKSHMTPLVVWNNFDLETAWPNLVSTYQMPAYLCNDLGIKSDVYFNYTYENQIPIVLNNLQIIDGDTQIDINTWDDNMTSIWHNVWLLQYDRMFGKKFSME